MRKITKSDLAKYTKDELIESMSAELEQTENKLSELLYYVTGGRFSKTDYSTDDMRRFVDDYNQSVCSECEELEQVKRERDAAVEDISRECHKCKHFKVLFNGCTPDYDCDRSDVCRDNDNWQWRGVKEENDE